MEWKGQIVRIEQDYMTGNVQATFTIEKHIANFLNELKGIDLRIKADKYRNKRSLDANALLWVCLDKIAEKLRTDKWSVYLKMLKDYGKFTYICVKPNVVEAVKAQWRECEVVGEYEVNGQKAIQMLCYFGSSTYDSKEFSRLLEGVIYEMRELGLEAPTSEEMRNSIEKWKKENGI